MTPTDAREFADLIRRLDVAFDKPSNDEKRNEYWTALKDVSIGSLREAVSAHVRNGKYYPRVADLRAIMFAAPSVPKRLPPEAHDIDGEHTYVCTACEDTGWLFISERTNTTAPVVRRCHCHPTNPAIRTR